MAKFHRKQSKRVTCHKKYKIIKRVAEHNRKLRKKQKKDGKRKAPKDPGVPNSLPFKDEILREAELRKQRAADIKQLQKEGRLKKHLENRGLLELCENAESRRIEFENKSVPSTFQSITSSVNQTPTAYRKEFKKVVDAADIVLEVLDARDPLGSRCPQVEQAVISAGTNKHLVLVLNKIDLIPRTNMEKWLKYLRQEFPTVAFKASTQSQNENLSHSKVAAIHINEKLQLSRQCIGANYLMKLLGNYCRNKNILTSIRVGVVGFPNVGKSSIINSLKRAKTCTVGATPGITKHLQEIIIDKHIRLLDSPGVVLAKNGSTSSLALRNAIKIETLEDVITPAEAILQRASKEQLMLHYCISDFNSPSEFLSMLAKRIGRFGKGGIPNIEAGARKLLNDWNMGKIKYYTHPPETHELPIHISSEYVLEMGKAFDIDALDKEMELDAVPIFPSSKGVLVQSQGFTDGIDVDEDVEVDMGDNEVLEGDNIEMVVDKDQFPQMSKVTVELEPKVVREISAVKEKEIKTEMQQNKARKKAHKKKKKNRKKFEKQSVLLSNAMEAVLSFGNTD